VVCLDRPVSGVETDAVLLDNVRGSRECVRHLIQMGHRRIALITGQLQAEISRERLKGYEEALREADIKVDPTLVMEGDFREESGYRLTRQLLQKRIPVTAIFACNDLMAFGVLQAARELNLRCPEDLSIAGFDSLEFTKFTDPSLTSVYQPGYQLGATAARLLLQRVDGMRFAPKKLLLPTELKKRNSVGPPHTTVATSTERTLKARERSLRLRRKNRA